MPKLELQHGMQLVILRQTLEGFIELVHHQVMISQLLAMHERHQEKLQSRSGHTCIEALV